MKKKQSYINVWVVVTLALVVVATPSVGAQDWPVTVDINSRSNSEGNPVQLELGPGTYRVTPVDVEGGGSFDAWSAWRSTSCSDPNGCRRTSPTSVTGWVNIYSVLSPNIRSVAVEGRELSPVAERMPRQDYFLATEKEKKYVVDDGLAYPNALVASENARSSVFTVDASGPVGFAITDSRSMLRDNRGGMSLVVVPVEIVRLVRDFPTAARGAGSSTAITFVQSATTTSQVSVSAIFRSPLGEVLDRQSIVLNPNATSSVVFEGQDVLEVGHIETTAGPGVVVTEVINLSLPGFGDLPPIGVGPSPSCKRPVTALKQNLEFDTGVALSNTNPEIATCNWSIYSGTEGTLVGRGATMVPPLGQTQSFPLSDPFLLPLPPPFEGNIQYDCDTGVHPLSFFQRRTDGALFSNATGCVDGTAPVECRVALADVNLESAVKERLGIDTEDRITCDQAERLNSLTVRSRNIQSLEGIGALSNLRSLDLFDNSIENLQPIGQLSELVVLVLQKNAIRDIRPLAALTRLFSLNLTANPISDIRPLAGLTTLDYLALSFNEISDISPLADISNLRQLTFSFNSASDIGPLAALTQLTFLSLTGNTISDIQPLSGLTQLGTLALNLNAITDIKALVENPGLGAGDTVWLQNNPLTAGNCADIQTLIIRGVDVQHQVDCP